MRNLLKRLKSNVMLQIAIFVTTFMLMSLFVQMNEETEEQVQVTYSVTLESLALANGETGGGCTCLNNPGTYYKGYPLK